jgi:ATP-binding cassette subfamily B protein
MAVIPWVVGKTIDWHIVPASGGAPDWSGVLRMGAVFALITLAVYVTECVNWILVSRVGQEAMRDLRMAIFRHLQTLSLSYFDRTPVGRILTRLTSDVSTLNELLSSGIVGVIQQLFMIAGILVLLLLVNWKLFLVSLVVMPFVYIAAWNFRHNVRKHYRETRRRLAQLNAFLQENITGMRTSRPTRRSAASSSASLRSITPTGSPPWARCSTTRCSSRGGSVLRGGAGGGDLAGAARFCAGR